MCGRITGYALSTPDAFRGSENSSAHTECLDGVSLTHDSPRQHIWSLTFVRECDNIIAA